jgi:hypothetical protein
LEINFTGFEGNEFEINEGVILHVKKSGIKVIKINQTTEIN